jgi:hypothetical protein
MVSGLLTCLLLQLCFIVLALLWERSGDGEKTNQ